MALSIISNHHAFLATWTFLAKLGYEGVSNFNSFQNNAIFVNGSWVVESALSSPPNSIGAQWIGIGGPASGSNDIGNPSDTLIQIGTSSCFKETATIPCHSSSGASYGAWFMVFNAVANSLINISSMSINAGDRIKASIKLVNGNWIADINDTSRANDANTITVSQSVWNVVNDSADWLEERPGVGHPLTNFVTADYPTGNATISSITGDIQSFDNYRINMTLIPSINSYQNSSTASSLCGSVLPCNGSYFDVYDFRVANLNTSKSSVTQGESYILTDPSQKLAIAAIAGGGWPRQDDQADWIVENPLTSSFVNATYCPHINASQSPLTCTVSTTSTTPLGTYTYEINATNYGDSSETVYSNQTSINVYPNGIIDLLPITLSNGQSKATPAPFQQQIILDSNSYINTTNWKNVAFFYTNGTEILAWLESFSSSKATYWIKLANGINANADINIYAGYASCLYFDYFTYWRLAHVITKSPLPNYLLLSLMAALATDTVSVVYL